MGELILKEEVFAIVGTAIEVHRELGAGFLETSGLRFGILIDFGSHGKLEWKRYVR